MASAVTDLRRAYRQGVLSEQESSTPPATATMSNGGMLSKAFHGLFDHVYEEYTAAMADLRSLDTPKSWRKVDVIREAGELQASSGLVYEWQLVTT